MLAHVRTKTGWSTVERHLFDQAALHQNAQTIIDRGERNLRHSPFRPLENLFSSGVIVTFRDDFEYSLSLAGGTKAARRELGLETFFSG